MYSYILYSLASPENMISSRETGQKYFVMYFKENTLYINFMVYWFQKKTNSDNKY